MRALETRSFRSTLVRLALFQDLVTLFVAAAMALLMSSVTAPPASCHGPRIGIEAELEDEEHKPPKKLSSTVKVMLKEEPELSWDDAVWRLVDLEAEG